MLIRRAVASVAVSLAVALVASAQPATSVTDEFAPANGMSGGRLSTHGPPAAGGHGRAVPLRLPGLSVFTGPPFDGAPAEGSFSAAPWARAGKVRAAVTARAPVVSVSPTPVAVQTSPPVPALPVPPVTSPPPRPQAQLALAAGLAPAPASAPAAAPRPTAADAPVPEPPVPVEDPWLRQRADEAVAMIAYPWGELGYEAVFSFGRSDMRGRTLLKERRIEIFVRRGDTVTQTAFDLAHEIAHAFDFTYGSAFIRGEWQRARGLQGTAWFGCNACDDLGTPAGDFAESFAVSQVPAGNFSSRLGPRPDAVQRDLLARLTTV